MASGSGGSGKSSGTKRSTSASRRGKKRQSGNDSPRWVADAGGRTGHYEGNSGIYDDIPF